MHLHLSGCKPGLEQLLTLVHVFQVWFRAMSLSTGSRPDVDLLCVLCQSSHFPLVQDVKGYDVA